MPKTETIPYYYETEKRRRGGVIHHPRGTSVKDLIASIGLSAGDKILMVYHESDTENGEPFITDYCQLCLIP